LANISPLVLGPYGFVNFPFLQLTC
jgi:hypothetical protein